MKPIRSLAWIDIRSLITAVLLGAGAISTAGAEDFGRFFTTPMQRQYLDQLKSRGAPIVVKIDEEPGAMDQQTQQAEVVDDAVTIKGLVYRKDGNSAAWLNESNSYQGDVASGYAGVVENSISPSRVKVRIGNQDNDITMKVGQKYEPASESVKDIIEEPGSEISVKRR
jgi:hypothetical protein